jgi:hypothetical protein
LSNGWRNRGGFVQLPKTILQRIVEQVLQIIIQDVLEQLPKAVKKEIGFMSQLDSAAAQSLHVQKRMRDGKPASIEIPALLK